MLRSVVLILFINLLGSNNAFAHRSVTWLHADFKPCNIVNSDILGYCDQVEEMLFAQLSQFRFDKKFASIPRIMADMNNQIPFCTSTLLKNDSREEKMIFSQPLYYIIPAIAVIHEQNSRFTGYVSQGMLDIELLKKEQVSYGLRNQRFYGPRLDSFISNLSGSKFVYMSDSETVLADMLRGRRLDMIFLNPAEVSVYDEYDDFVGLPIKDGNVVPAYASCTRSPRGTRLIYAINTAINKLTTTTLSAPYESWLPESIKPYYRQQVAIAEGAQAEAQAKAQVQTPN